MEFPVHLFFLHLFTILIVARIFGELFAHIGIPSVLGELFAGIVLGPSVLGWIEPNAVLHLLAEIGIILLLFEVGLETDIRRLAQAGRNASVLAVVGAALPFAFGFATAHYLFHLSTLISLFIGGTLTATSIGITLRILKDIHQSQGEIAQVVIGAAVIDDILGVILLVFVYDYAVNETMSFDRTLKVTGMIIAFLLLAPVVAKGISALIRQYHHHHRVPGFLPTIVIALILLCAFLSHEIGAPEILGAFAAGLALSRRFFLPFGLSLRTDPRFLEAIDHNMRPIVQLFTPIFFVVVGLSLDLSQLALDNRAFWVMSGAFLLVAVVGKYIGGLVTVQRCAANKMLLGVSMIPRGEVGLVFAELGRSQGILDNNLYAVLLMVIIVTTLVPPFLLKWMFKFQCEVSFPPQKSQHD